MQGVSAAETLNISHRPDGKIADVLASTLACPHGKLSRFARCLQGGGVAVFGGTVAISSCTISGNTVFFVRAHPQKLPMPRWENC